MPAAAVGQSRRCVRKNRGIRKKEQRRGNERVGWDKERGQERIEKEVKRKGKSKRQRGKGIKNMATVSQVYKGDVMKTDRLPFSDGCEDKDREVGLKCGQRPSLL